MGVTTAMLRRDAAYLSGTNRWCATSQLYLLVLISGKNSLSATRLDKPRFLDYLATLLGADILGRHTIEPDRQQSRHLSVAHSLTTTTRIANKVILINVTSRGAAQLSNARRRAMQLQRGENTKPEVDLRRELYRLGLRYRLHQAIVPGTRRRVDIVFPGPKIAVDVRGCFWHGCPQHATQPKSNVEWWREKLDANRSRDRDTCERLENAGWKLIVVWEHEKPEVAALRIREIHEAFRRETPPDRFNGTVCL